MAIHYDSKSKRFRDDSGHFVAKARAMRSSIARREYDEAQKVLAKKTASRRRGASGVHAERQNTREKAKTKGKAVSHAKLADGERRRKAAVEDGTAPTARPVLGVRGDAAKKAAKRRRRKRPVDRPSPRVEPPWDVEGIIREFPDPSEWFPDLGAWDYGYSYDEISDDWGGYADDDTTSAGPSGVEDGDEE